MAAIKFIEINKTGDTLSLSATNLEEILNRDEIRDRSLVVISVTGAMRKGKRFLLSWFIRYLKANYTTKHPIKNWIENPDEKLTQLPWQSDKNNKNANISVWSEIFCHDYPDGRKIAILLLIVEGTFESKSKVDSCISIFSLATILSSHQIFNVANNIHPNDLKTLSLILENGRAAIQDSVTDSKFQSFMFLIRDWTCPHDAPFGLEGGKQFFSRQFDINDETNNFAVLENIKSSFKEIDCFLMPYPGTKVASKFNFRGCTRDIDTNFMENLEELVYNTLDKSNIKVKFINDAEMKAKDFINYSKKYLNILTNGTLPNPREITVIKSETLHDRAQSLDVKNNFNNSIERPRAMQDNSNDRPIELLKMIEKFEEEIRNDINLVPNNILVNDQKSLKEIKMNLEDDLEIKFFNKTNKKFEQFISGVTAEKVLTKHLNQQNTKAIFDLIQTIQNLQDHQLNEIIIVKFIQSLDFENMNSVLGIIKMTQDVVFSIFRTESKLLPNI